MPETAGIDTLGNPKIPYEPINMFVGETVGHYYTKDRAAAEWLEDRLKALALSFLGSIEITTSDPFLISKNVQQPVLFVSFDLKSPESQIPVHKMVQLCDHFPTSVNLYVQILWSSGRRSQLWAGPQARKRVSQHMKQEVINKLDVLTEEDALDVANRLTRYHHSVEFKEAGIARFLREQS